MNRLIYLILPIILSLSPMVGYAEDDMAACESVLCLSGLLQGESSGSECSDAIKDYFGIQVYKMGSFKPSATQKKRGNYLNGCESADESWKDDINQTYGKLEMGIF